MESEPLISLHRKSDFELKLFYKRQVKELETENGKLLSYVQELEDKLSKINGKYKPEITKLQEANKDYKFKIKGYKDRIKQLEKENQNLLNQKY